MDALADGLRARDDIMGVGAVTDHEGCLAFGLRPQHQIPDAPKPDPEMEALLYQVSRAGSHERDLDWACPGCGVPYDDLPVGHCWTYGLHDGGGSCSV